MSAKKKTGVSWILVATIIVLAVGGWWLMNQKPAQSQPLAAMDAVPAAAGSQATH